MKTTIQRIRKCSIVFIVISISMLSYGQEEKSSTRLEYEYFSITPVEVYYMKNIGGVALTSTLGFTINEHLISLNASTGGEFVILGTSSTFYQVNLVYGREFKLSPVVHIDVHAGGGIFGFNDHRELKLRRFGLPLIAKLRFKTGERFSLGLKFQANINSFKNLLATGIVLQWNSSN
ncbi:MAG: hypothetical protein KJO77_10445 [Bacteroidia bacterium]|nr:hypothetical protein [Bacteroidia bacterium]NND50882.1 hypothetical protein [Flavobacteriaceae bacterium]